MTMMKAAIVATPGGPFELVERPIPEPAAGEVLIKVEACGICRGDAGTKEARHPGIKLPRVPGHEVVGIVAGLGTGSTKFAVGSRVGAGYRAGSCGVCPACLAGNIFACHNALAMGQSVDGGYAEYMIAREEILVAIPEGLSAAEAAPLLCAGRTTFAALRNAGAGPGDLVAIQGIGGLGHLAIQYAAKIGCRTAVLSRGTWKEALARELGAEIYIDTSKGDAAAQLQALGGAKVLLCTAPNAKLTSSLIAGVGANGRVVVVAGTNEPLEVPMRALFQGIQISGAGQATMAEALRFSVEAGVKPMIETFPLAEVATAFDKMMDSTVNFRSVLVMGA